MTRSRGQKCAGGNWSSEEIYAVWEKGQILPGQDPAVFRLDDCGALIKNSHHGKMTPHGWEVDHIQPCSKGGIDDLTNLQPLHWENNRHKGDDYPDWDCKKTL